MDTPDGNWAEATKPEKRYIYPMQGKEVVNALIPSPKQVLDLIVDSERHRKFVWTAGRVLKEAALWTRVEALQYDDRKFVLNRVAGFLEDLAVRGILQRRSEPQSIGYGDEVGFDYVRSQEEI
jgi:hypothetical protein